ncbi:3D domain-containing protein [Rossellomorea aquimaris]
MKKHVFISLLILFIIGSHTLSLQAKENSKPALDGPVDGYHNISEGDMLWNLAYIQEEAVLTIETRQRLIHEGKEALAPARSEKAQETNKDSVIKEVEVKATAYTAYCDGCIGITKTGVDLRANPDEKVIAVDPAVIPLGSKVYVEGFGYATAEDTGSAIKGNRIDIFIPSREEALEYGVKGITVQVIE